MIELFNENEVTAKNIANHMVSVGFIDEVDPSTDHIEVVMESGLPYFISICKTEKYIKIGTCFCPGKKKTIRLRRALKEAVHSGPLFFSAFPNGDEETHVQCIVNYEYGLLPNQFISMVSRFEDFIERAHRHVSRNIKPLVPA